MRSRAVWGRIWGWVRCRRVGVVLPELDVGSWGAVDAGELVIVGHAEMLRGSDKGIGERRAVYGIALVIGIAVQRCWVCP